MAQSTHLMLSPSKDLDIWSEVGSFDPNIDEDDVPPLIDASAPSSTSSSHANTKEAIPVGQKKETTVLTFGDKHFLILWPSSYADALHTASVRTSLPTSEMALYISKFGVDLELDDRTWAACVRYEVQHLIVKKKEGGGGFVPREEKEKMVVISYEGTRLAVPVSKAQTYTDLTRTIGGLFSLEPTEARFFIHHARLDAAEELLPLSSGGDKEAMYEWKDGEVVFVKVPEWPEISREDGVGKDSLWIRFGHRTVLTSKPRKSDTIRFIETLKAHLPLPANITVQELEFFVPSEHGKGECIRLTEEGWESCWESVRKVVVRVRKESEDN